MKKFDDTYAKMRIAVCPGGYFSKPFGRLFQIYSDHLQEYKETFEKFEKKYQELQS